MQDLPLCHFAHWSLAELAFRTSGSECDSFNFCICVPIFDQIFVSLTWMFWGVHQPIPNPFQTMFADVEMNIDVGVDNVFVSTKNHRLKLKTCCNMLGCSNSPATLEEFKLW